MKLQCDVEVVNRMLPSCGLKSRGRSSRAVLSIGRPADRSSSVLLICTGRDRSGTKYKLKENIEKFFTWFVEEGKATVRLKEPAVDVCLSNADSGVLKSFLAAVRRADRCVETDQAVVPLGPVRARDVEAPRRRLTVLSKKNYPLTSGFPSTLEQLTVSYCRLSRVDARMLALRALRRLDLSHNHIRVLPACVGELGQLAELVLHNNRLQSLCAGLCSSGLQGSLQLLDLSRNQLTELPEQICHLRRLVSLKLDENRLTRLPFHVDRLSALRYLSAANNRITLLPHGFRRLRLENLDLFGNPFIQPNALDLRIQLIFPLTLQELAARAVLDHRLPRAPHLLPRHLCDELDFSSVCECGRACVSSFIQTCVSLNLHQVSHTVVLVDSMGGTEAPLLKRFCSLHCCCCYMDWCAQHKLR